MKCKSITALSGLVVLALGLRASGQVSASGVLNLQAINGTDPGNLTYTYDITLRNTGTSNIGSFWYAWLPPDNYYDLLQDTPDSESNPPGWVANIEGENNGDDNNSIQWVDNGDPMTPGQTLTFGFTTVDDPPTVTGVTRAGVPVGYSYVYAGAPEQSEGGLLQVATGSLTPPVPEPASIGLLALAGVLACGRKRQRM